jgi:hypothetical protein
VLTPPRLPLRFALTLTARLLEAATADPSQDVGSARKPQRGLKFREASLGDYDQIAKLEARYWLHTKNYEEWSHLWLGNPLYRELQVDWSIGWVIENEAGRIVASMENIPLAYEFQGQRILAATGRAWAADPDYRSAALLLLERVINQPGIDLYINTTFSPASMPAITVFNCARVPTGVWDRSAFWITHPRGFARSYLALKEYPMAELLSYPLAALVYLRGSLTGPRWKADDVTVLPSAGFDARFDVFWDDLRRQNPHLLLAVRTSELLHWHYKYMLLNDRIWIGTISEGDRLLAYAVFERRDKRSFGLKRVRLVDFQSLDQSPTLLIPLLAWALKRCHEQGIHVLEHVGRWLEEGQVLDRIMPYRRTLPSWIYAYRAARPDLAERLADQRAWAPWLYDGDASLIR